jgi:hypothetical protein
VVAQPSHVYRRRRAAAAGVLLLVLMTAAGGVAAISDDSPSENSAARAQAPTPTPAPPELPRGGRRILPDFRVVAFYGAPQSDELGALGIGTPDQAARRLERQARPYARKTRPVLPALELIAVIANAHPGDDGLYRTRQTDAVIRRYLRAARRHKALLLLDLQPGRADFFTETVRLEKWLREPDVGLALDPEWRVQPGQVPGNVIGHVAAREVNATSAWLDQLVRRRNLPRKLFVIHQFTDDMVDDRALKLRSGLDMVLNVDGFGGRAVKIAKYRAFTAAAPRFHQGFKLFYKEDVGLMSPGAVLRMGPPPDLVVYE